MSKGHVLEKTIQIMEKELKGVKTLQGKKSGATSLKGFLKGADISEKDIEEAKARFNTVKSP